MKHKHEVLIAGNLVSIEATVDEESQQVYVIDWPTVVTDDMKEDILEEIEDWYREYITDFCRASYKMSK